MLYGKDWKQMQPLIKTRTLVQIRTHAQKVFKKAGLKKIEKNMSASTLKNMENGILDVTSTGQYVSFNSRTQQGIIHCINGYDLQDADGGDEDTSDDSAGEPELHTLGDPSSVMAKLVAPHEFNQAYYAHQQHGGVAKVVFPDIYH